MWQYVAFHNVG